jgi:hypothetical protein
MAREVTQRPWWSFIAAWAYCLLAPSQLLVPDAEFRWRHVRDAPRILGAIAWDEVPHQLGLACVLLSVAFLVRGLRGRRYSFWAAGILLSFAMLISAFGGTVGFFFLALLCLSWQKHRPVKNLLPIAACGIAAYLAVCPFYPPSLIQVIRQNANLSSDYGWTPASIWAVLIVVAGTVVLLVLSGHWAAWHMRFFVLLTFVFLAIPFLQRWDLHFLPQAGRYKVELDLVLALLGTFSAALWLERVPPTWRVVLAALLLIPAVSIVKSHRVYAKYFLRASDVHDTIEYQVASWLLANAPQQRVMAPGSIGSWMNDFTPQPQLMGGSFTTMPTLTMQIGTWGVMNLNPTEPQRDVAKLWLQAYGVDALVVPGPASPEPWKKFVEPTQFQSLFPLLWRERDTSIYSVPRTYRSLASIVPENRIVRRKLVSFFQLDEIQPYVAAMEDSSSQADWEWLNNNAGLARGIARPGSVLSLHITYHPGWKAFVNNSPVRVAADGLEQIVVWPNCTGPCEVKLIYDGGTEAKLTRVISVVTLLAAGLIAVLQRRRLIPAGPPG